LNLQYLTDKYSNVKFAYGDIRNYYDVDPIVRKEPFDVIFHLAAQVAVTTSVVRPREDFEINALGTLNILEAMREVNSKAMLVYASTNKVYGEMLDLSIEEIDGRYQYKDVPEGITEEYLLDFHSPYGCSKGAADQYVIDYSRIYGLKTALCSGSLAFTDIGSSALRTRDGWHGLQSRPHSARKSPFTGMANKCGMCSSSMTWSSL
jgi:CDP-paratose 2-epimerase